MRDYSKLNASDLINDVNVVDWQNIMSGSADCDSMFQTFHQTLVQIIDEHAPLRKLSKRELKLKRKPWITNAIRKSIQIKDKLLKTYLKTKSQEIYTKYKKYRNKLKHLVNISKKRYYNDYFSKNHKDPKSIWKGIKQIVTPKSNTSFTPTAIEVNGKEVNDKEEISNTFNDFFVEIASSVPFIETNPLDYINSHIQGSLFLSPITAEEIQKEIMSLNSKKACGPFSIPVKLLKLIKSPISKPLELLFNHSLSTGKVPQDFKIARVIPVFKNGSKTDINNYRPISLISVYNKLLEKLVYKRVLVFLENNKMIYSKQFGFRSNHSTEQALLFIVNKIQNAIENREFSCGIFLDFSKAFDTVDHKILLDKLDYYGIRGVAKEWFISYLKDRKQYVSIGNVKSDYKNISCGVPQGSVLGPLLFLLYINDLKECLHLLDAHLFADDTNLFYSGKNLKDLETTVNSELKEVQTWLSANKLSLNITKSYFVIFRPHQKNIPFQIHLSINNELLKQEECIKYLGIFLDSHLKWRFHINYITKKINRNIGLLSKLRHLVNKKILIELYYSFIFPYLIYSLIIWGNTYSTILYPLCTIQKRAIRIITFSSYRDHSTPLFKLTNILKLTDLIYFQTAIFMYKFHHRMLPSLFDNYFTEISKTHNYSTRLSQKKSYCLPKIRTNYGIYNIRYQGPKVWNSINKTLRDEMHISTFKTKLKSRLIDLYDENI